MLLQSDSSGESESRDGLGPREEPVSWGLRYAPAIQIHVGRLRAGMAWAPEKSSLRLPLPWGQAADALS